MQRRDLPGALDLNRCARRVGLATPQFELETDCGSDPEHSGIAGRIALCMQHIPAAVHDVLEIWLKRQPLCSCAV